MPTRCSLNPEFLADPDYACISAAWYWGENGLNRWADIGDFDTLTKQINHAKLGIARARRVLEARPRGARLTP
jgi:putative chitinase